MLGRLVRTLLAMALALAASIFVSGPALAAPYDENVARDLARQLEEASRGFLAAEQALGESRQRQAGLQPRLAEAESRLAAASPQADEIFAGMYRTGGSATTASMLLGAGSAAGFVDRAESLRVVAVRNERQIRGIKTLRDELAAAKTAVDNEIRLQEQQVAAMAKRKHDAEAALAAYGTGQPAGPPGDSGARPPTASPAPGGGGCKPDPTGTGGCITPRLLHALTSAQGAGFRRYTACWRKQEDGGEHPRGRACDFSVSPKPGTFGGVAAGGDKQYGTDLANYFIANSRPLGVLYVIWFERIWLPSSGWRAYTRGNGDPSSDHTNHVHLSVTT